MFELLEDLRPQFSAALRRRVDLAELTFISIQLTPRQAVVVTNRNIYIMQHGILGLRTKVVSLRDVALIRVEGKDLVLEGEKGSMGRMGFARKKELQGPVFNKLQSLLS